MIANEIFRSELDGLLKRQKIKKARRNKIIVDALSNIPCDKLNEFLDDELTRAVQFEFKNKEAKRIPTEFEEHIKFVDWFKKIYPSIKIMLIRNHGTRTPREKTDQMLEGLLPGAADLYVPEWHLWIEVKRAKGGKLSDDQIKFKDYVTNECRDNWMVIHGCEDGVKQILEWRNI